MAKNDNLNDFLLDIANVIRSKTGSEELVNPQDFSTIINQLGNIEEDSNIQYLIVDNSDYSRSEFLTAFAISAKIITEDDKVIYGPGIEMYYMIQESYKYLIVETDYDKPFCINGVIQTTESLIGNQFDDIQRIPKDIFYSIGSSIVFPFVDLGLPSGTLWATRNMGATNPEDSGLFFGWGETVGKLSQNYYYGNYKFGAYGSGSKYNETDSLTILENEDDAVYQLDSSCQIPTVADCEELLANTNITEEYVNKVACFRLTSKINNNSIVIPRTGYAYNKNTVGSEVFLWTNQRSDPSGDASNLCIKNYSEIQSLVTQISRHVGLPIRAIKYKQI